MFANMILRCRAILDEKRAGSPSPPMRVPGERTEAARDVPTLRAAPFLTYRFATSVGMLGMICLVAFWGADVFAATVAEATRERDPAIQFEGESVYFYYGPDGQPHPDDTNRFVAVVQGCAWSITLFSQAAPEHPTQVADDGENYYVHAKGPGTKGTTKVGQRMREYVDSASIHDIRRTHPRHHGAAVWLLFASSCEMASMTGQVAGIQEVGYGLKDAPIAYEKVLDKEKNSLGPARIRLFARDPMPNATREFVEGELEVKSAAQEGAVTFPSEVEFRGFVSGKQGEKARSLFAYKLSVSSCKVLPGPPEIRPSISSATSIADYRFPIPFEYVSASWVSKAEALRLLNAGSVRRYSPADLAGAPAQSRRLLVLTCMVFTGFFVAVLTLRGLWKRKNEVNTERNERT